MELETWTAEDVAVHLDCTARHITDRVSHYAGFPPALPGGRKKRWLKVKVLEFLDAWQGQKLMVKSTRSAKPEGLYAR